VIELHQYPSIYNLSSLSPFCIKVEVFLRKHKIPYKIVVQKNPARGPKGKMPFIRDGHTEIADSTLIIHYLSEKLGIEPEQSPIAHAFQRMIEEHLYFVLLYSRWIDPIGFYKIKSDFTSLFPPIVGTPFLYLIRRNLKKQAHAQGLGRHSKNEVYEMGRRDLQAIASQLGENPYIMGSSFTAIDATVFAFLTTILKQPIESPLKKALQSFPNLVSYCERQDALLFPEFHNEMGTR
jgi:glutathione S-transferase